MKTLEMSEATARLSEYARAARREPLLITLKGKPYVTLAAAGPRTDLENLTVTTHPKFLAMMQRSERRWREEGGLTSDQVREQLGIKRRAAKRKAHRASSTQR